MIEYLTLETAGELDQFVADHPRGHYMQTSVYGRSRQDYDWSAIALRNEEGGILASVALQSRKSRFAGMRLFYAPRGPVFTSREDFRAIIQAAKVYCRENRGYLLRIDPPVGAEDGLFRQEAEALGFRFDPRNDYSTYQPKNVYQTKLEGLTEAELLARFHPKTRYNIRLSRRRGVSVRVGSLSDLPVFCSMMEETARRDGFCARSQEFYGAFLCSAGKNARLLLAEKNGQILAGAIEMILGRKAWYVYGCSFTQGRGDMPNYLLQWEMMRHALGQGCSVYDFRGVEGDPVPENPHYGLHRFKQGFDARFVEYAGQMDLVLRPGICRVIRMGLQINRILSRVCAETVQHCPDRSEAGMTADHGNLHIGHSIRPCSPTGNDESSN